MSSDLGIIDLFTHGSFVNFAKFGPGTGENNFECGRLIHGVIQKTGFQPGGNKLSPEIVVLEVFTKINTDIYSTNIEKKVVGIMWG